MFLHQLALNPHPTAAQSGCTAPEAASIFSGIYTWRNYKEGYFALCPYGSFKDRFLPLVRTLDFLLFPRTFSLVSTHSVGALTFLIVYILSRLRFNIILCVVNNKIYFLDSKEAIRFKCCNHSNHIPRLLLPAVMLRTLIPHVHSNRKLPRNSTRFSTVQPWVLYFSLLTFSLLTFSTFYFILFA